MQKQKSKFKRKGRSKMKMGPDEHLVHKIENELLQDKGCSTVHGEHRNTSIILPLSDDCIRARLKIRGTSIVVCYDETNFIFLIDSKTTFQSKAKLFIMDIDCSKFRLLPNNSVFIVYAGDCQLGTDVLDHLAGNARADSTLEEIVIIARRYTSAFGGEAEFCIGGWRQDGTATAVGGTVINNDSAMKYQNDWSPLKRDPGWTTVAMGCGSNDIRHCFQRSNPGPTVLGRTVCLRSAMADSVFRNPESGGYINEVHLELQSLNPVQVNIVSQNKQTTKLCLLQNYGAVMGRGKQLFLLYDKSQWRDKALCESIMQRQRSLLELLSVLLNVKNTELSLCGLSYPNEEAATTILGRGEDIVVPPTNDRSTEKDIAMSNLMFLLRESGFRKYEAGERAYYIGRPQREFLEGVEEADTINEEDIIPMKYHILPDHDWGNDMSLE